MTFEKQVTIAPLQLEDEIAKRRVTNRKRGADLSWSNANQFMSLKKGYPLMVAGVGGAGKTELVLDIMINASIMHGYTWLILSPEMGTAEEIIEQLLEKVSAGETLEPGERSMSKDKFERLMVWVNKHFRILDPMRQWKDNFHDLALNIENMFTAVQYEEQRLGGKFDGILIDPFNELDIELGGPRTMSTVKNELDALLWWTKKNNYLTILTNHVNNKQEIRQTINGQVTLWTPPAKKEDWAYGQQFGRKGYQMVLIYEPHKAFQIMDAENGDREMQHSQENFFNVREIYVQKTKPKGVGKTGRFKLFFDRKVQRYYELDSIGMKKGIIYPQA
jgi:hypothetical protein